MTEMQQVISAALALLKEAEGADAEPPATVVLPPDSGRFIIGNPQGFVNLAIASLKAAQGQEQSFKDHAW